MEMEKKSPIGESLDDQKFDITLHNIMEKFWTKKCPSLDNFTHETRCP